MSTLDIAPDGGPAEPSPRPEPSPVLDRAISPISGRLSAGLGGKAVTLVALAAGCTVFILATGHHGSPKSRAPVQPASQVVPFEPASPPALAAPPTLDASSPADAPGQVPAVQPGANGSSGLTAAQAAAQARAAQLRAIRGAPILAFNGDGGGGPLGLPGLITPASAPAEPAHAATELDQLREGSNIALARASRLPNRHFLIVAGTSIPCTLQTAMDTATPGYVSCLIGQDVYSDDGGVVLMEKGSRVLGEYRSGMKQGQSRLFVLWDRAVTPAGVAIGLASPASDALGRAGFDGTIDTHFWDRFGGALLLSIIDDASAAAATRTDSNGETVRVPSDAAGIALQNSINIPPSLKKPQGSEVSIFVAQDLDFSTVYGLKAR